MSETFHDLFWVSRFIDCDHVAEPELMFFVLMLGYALSADLVAGKD